MYFIKMKFKLRNFGLKKTRKKLAKCMLALLGLCLTIFLFKIAVKDEKQRTDSEPTVTASSLCEPRELINKQNCYNILNANKTELGNATQPIEGVQHQTCPIANLHFVNLTGNCEKFKKERKYLIYSSSVEEMNFPLAYGILVYQHVEQVERLLQLIYRQHNIYCIHVDKNAHSSVLEGIKNICKCFPNIFISSKLESIVYAGFSRLQADINCMKDALRKNSKWKYFINLSGEMFPLKTNLEILRILKTYNDTNDVEGTLGTEVRLDIQDRWNKTLPPPEGLTIVKGSAYGTFTRKFVDFALYNAVAQDFLKWTNDTYSPDEIFWSTLHYTNYNPHLKTPGGYAEKSAAKHKWRSVHVSWPLYDLCYGMKLRDICIPGINDFPRIVSRRELFLNKLKPFDYDYEILECLEEWFLNKTERVIPRTTNLPTNKNKKIY